MGILSKIFGGNKLELADDVDEVVPNNQKEEQKNQNNSNNNQNDNPSPFLVDDEDNK